MNAVNNLQAYQNSSLPRRYLPRKRYKCEYELEQATDFLISF